MGCMGVERGEVLMAGTFAELRFRYSFWCVLGKFGSFGSWSCALLREPGDGGSEQSSGINTYFARLRLVSRRGQSRLESAVTLRDKFDFGDKISFETLCDETISQ